MKKLSLLSYCFNEAENIEPLCREVERVMATLPQYDWELDVIDNASTDGTQEVLRRLAADQPRLRVILNARNFGHIRSPFHGLIQCDGDAVIYLASDLEEPPALIPEMVAAWEQGSRVVAAVKRSTRDSWLLGLSRRVYYWFLGRISHVELVPHFTGFGLYDQQVVRMLRRIDDPYPYLRGLISEIGFTPAIVRYDKPARPRGVTKNNFFTLYDMAMLGVTRHSVAPIRLAALGGFVLSLFSLLIALAFLVLKLLFWHTFTFGLAPILIGMFFLASVQLFFIGMLGEYIAAIQTHVRKLPHVVERERINFPAERQSPVATGREAD